MFKKFFIGKIGRKKFALNSILCAFWFPLTFLTMVLISKTFGISLGSEEAKTLSYILVTSGILLSTFFYSSGVVRRLRDIGKNWVYVFVTFVPFANLILGGYLLFTPGKVDLRN